MSSNPEFYVVKHAQWERFTESRTNAAYEEYDNWLDGMGLNGKLDIVAGMWYSPKDNRIYADEHLARAAFKGDPDAVELAKHEKGHHEQVPKHKHPTGAWSMFWHARSCGWDYRAGTRALRFNKNRRPPGFDAWWGHQRSLWMQGVLVPQDAPE